MVETAGANEYTVPPSDPGSYKSPFLQDFIHLNVAMMTSNNALVPDPDKQDDLASQFWQWPILHVGLRMCGWDDKSTSSPFPHGVRMQSALIWSDNPC